MIKIVPNDIIIETFKSEILSNYDGGIISRRITTEFTLTGDTKVKADIQYGEDVCIMEYYENGSHFKYYFSPNIAKRFFKKIYSEYPKLTSQQYRVDLSMMINKIKIYHLNCQEVVDGT